MMWSLPIVFKARTDGSLRFCMNNHKLNAVMERHSISIPRIDGFIENLGIASVVLSLADKGEF